LSGIAAPDWRPDANRAMFDGMKHQVNIHRRLVSPDVVALPS
jgi:hypothetical protein